MAHQAKSGIHTRDGKGTVLQRPVLAALLGCVVSDWAAIEDRLMILYAQIMGNWGPRIAGADVPLHPVGLQVFDELETLHHRLRLLTQLAAWAIRDEALVEELGQKVVPIVKKAAGARNVLAHAHWGVSDDYPDALILIKVFGANLVYEEADFHDALARIAEAGEAVSAFGERVRLYLRSAAGPKTILLEMTPGAPPAAPPPK